MNCIKWIKIKVRHAYGALIIVNKLMQYICNSQLELEQ